jgi:YidC/Oxa1 family membrane protein insertase
VEKRLPLALFLSLLVLIGWQVFFGPTEEEREAARRAEQAAAQQPPQLVTTTPGAPSSTGTTSAEPPPSTEPVHGALVGDPEEQTHLVSFGAPGRRGSGQALFTNRGGALLDLALADFVDKVGLDDEQRSEIEHWVRVVTSIESGDGPTASMVLRTSRSSRALERVPLERALWKTIPLENGIEFQLAQGTGVRFVKRFLFEPDSYRVHVTLEIHHEDAAGGVTPGRAQFLFTPAGVTPVALGDSFYPEPQAIAAGRSLNDAKKGTRLPKLDAVPPDLKGKKTTGDFDVPAEVTSFVGVHNKYFAVLLRAAQDPKSQGSLKGATWRRVYDQGFAEENPSEAAEGWRFVATDALLELSVPPVGESSTFEYVVYAGPKQRDELVGDYDDHKALANEDISSMIPGVETAAKLLIEILSFFQGLVGNWGIAIILMTLTVRIILFPLNRRSQTTMARYQKQMKKIQPKIDELKKKYEKEPDKQRKAQAELMQKEGLMPPLGGCLPIFIQMPIFFGLFQALRTSFDLRQAPFYGWITDLSQPDRLMEINVPFPFVGTIEYLNILPPLMVVLWIGQQMVMPKPADEQAQRMQRMMMFMPLLMGVFLYNYAAGLSLYMITQSFLGIFEIGVIKKLWPVDDTELPKKKKGFMTRLAEKQAEQMKRAQHMQDRTSATRSQAAKSRKRKKKSKR